MTPNDRRKIPSTTVAPLQVTPQEVHSAIMFFPQGSAAGPDGLRPQHLKDLLATMKQNEGEVFSDYWRNEGYISDSRVDNRPIAVGYVFSSPNR